MHCVCQYAPVEIMSELKKHILNFGYGINFKYKGMLAHSFDRFYVVTKFILPSVNDFDETLNYLQGENGCDHNSREYISDPRLYCRKIVPFIHFYRKQMFLVIKLHTIF